MCRSGEAISHSFRYSITSFDGKINGVSWVELALPGGVLLFDFGCDLAYFGAMCALSYMMHIMGIPLKNTRIIAAGTKCWPF